jgi:hypothetical protein
MNIILSLIVFLIGSISIVKAEVIVEIEDQSIRWQIVSEINGEDGALFVIKLEGQDSMNMGGDSVPFPLSRYNLPESVISKLADAYVQYELKNVGSLEALKSLISEIDEIPSDLHAAYSKLFEVSAQPYYGTSDTSASAMLVALRHFGEVVEDKEIKDKMERHLRPLAPELIIYLGEDPEDEVAKALIQAVMFNPSVAILQQAVAVYAARQEGKFRQHLGKDNQKRISEVAKAIRNASDAGLIGGSVKVAALRIADSLLVN